VRHGHEGARSLHGDAEFFREFTAKRRTFALRRVDLATRELPPASLMLATGPIGEQHTPLAIEQRRRNDPDGRRHSAWANVP